MGLCRHDFHGWSEVPECVVFRKVNRNLVQTEGKINRCERSPSEEGREWSHTAPGQGMLTASGTRVAWTDSALEPPQHLDSNTMKPIQSSALYEICSHSLSPLEDTDGIYFWRTIEREAGAHPCHGGSLVFGWAKSTPTSTRDQYHGHLDWQSSCLFFVLFRDFKAVVTSLPPTGLRHLTCNLNVFMKKTCGDSVAWEKCGYLQQNSCFIVTNTPRFKN